MSKRVWMQGTEKYLDDSEVPAYPDGIAYILGPGERVINAERVWLILAKHQMAQHGIELPWDAWNELKKELRFT